MARKTRKPKAQSAEDLIATLGAQLDTEPHRKGKLPPDPEGMNNDRAVWAEHAIQTFMHDTGVDPEDAICDLLADLKHLCDRKKNKYGEFDDALRRATDHYWAETQEEWHG